MKTKLVRIKKDDFDFFDKVVGPSKNQLDLFTKVKTRVIKGEQMNNIEKGIENLNKALFGEVMYNGIFPKTKKKK